MSAIAPVAQRVQGLVVQHVQRRVELIVPPVVLHRAPAIVATTAQALQDFNNFFDFIKKL